MTRKESWSEIKVKLKDARTSYVLYSEDGSELERSSANPVVAYTLHADGSATRHHTEKTKTA